MALHAELAVSGFAYEQFFGVFLGRVGSVRVRLCPECSSEVLPREKEVS